MAADLTLFLMTEKGFRVLQRLGPRYADRIACVVGAWGGEVQKDYYAEIKLLCNQLAIRFLGRGDHGGPDSRFSLAVSWRWLIDAQATELIVFHDSLLPKYRGFAPLVSALINGEFEIGVSAILASDEYDRGAIVQQARVAIEFPLKIARAIELVCTLYSDLAESIMEQLFSGDALQTQAQIEADASYSLWRDAADYRISWRHSADEIQRFVDAVSFPYQGAQTLLGDKLAKVLDVEVLADVEIENRTPGKVIFVREDCPVVVRGAGLLRLTRLEAVDSGESLLPLARFRSRFS